MKRFEGFEFMKRFTSICCAGCLCVSVVFAKPLVRADVASEPAWVVHVDVDGLKATSIGKFLLQELDKPDNQAKLSVFQDMFGMDLRTQLHGCTLYGTGDSPEDGVLLVYADFNPDKLENLAKAAEDYQSTNHNQHVIHNWLDDHKKRHGSGQKARTYAAIHANRVVIFGQRETSVAAALDVMDRLSQNLSSGKTFSHLGTGTGNGFIEAAARKLDLPGSDPHAALFRLSKMMRLQVGESQQKVTATLTLDAKDEDVANQMASVGQGLVALLKLQKEKAEVTRLADALAISQSGASVIATVKMPSDDLIQMLKAHAPGGEKHADKN
jgi:hypothetical protein